MNKQRQMNRYELTERYPTLGCYISLWMINFNTDKYFSKWAEQEVSTCAIWSKKITRAFKLKVIFLHNNTPVYTFITTIIILIRALKKMTNLWSGLFICQNISENLWSIIKRCLYVGNKLFSSKNKFWKAISTVCE